MMICCIQTDDTSINDTFIVHANSDLLLQVSTWIRMYLPQ